MNTRLCEMRCVLCTFLALACAWILSGCGEPPEATPPVFTGEHYAAVTTNTSTPGMPQAGTLALYYFPDGAKGASSPIWPYLTSPQQLVFDKLVIFNGGLSEEVSWKYYPALLAWNGNGNVVEISLPACRKITGWQSAWTNFAFSILAVSNDFVRLDASQTGGIDTNRPRRFEVDIAKADILNAMADARKNGATNEYLGVKYLVAP